MCLAMPGRIVSIADSDGTLMADVDFGDARKQVCLEYTPDAKAGDYVVVHVGFAIQQLDEAQAKEALACAAKERTDEMAGGVTLAANHAQGVKEVRGVEEIAGR